MHQGLVNSHVFTEFDDSEESPKGSSDSAVMWALEPLGMTIYIYIYIDAAVMWALEPLGMTIYIYIYILMLL